MTRIRKIIADNGLLVVFTSLFVLCLAGQALSGHALYNGVQAAHGLPPVGYARYVTTGEFLQGIFSNWQAAVLQLGSLIVFGVFLHQRGAPHSKRLGARRASQRSAPHKASRRTRRRHPRLLSTASWLYCHSLSLAFGLLFLVIFVLHLLSGAASYNAQQALAHQPQLSVGQFFVSAKFWFTTLQTWEAEYMAIALYVALSIFLREAGSPESKPPGARNSDTGDPNE